MVLGHLKGLVGSCWNFPTHTVGRGFWRGGEGRALPLLLPPGWGGELEGKPLPLATHVHGFLPVKSLGTILTLPTGMGGEENL